MFFDRVVMGLRPPQGDEKRLLSSNRSPWKRRLPLCHPERSRGIRSSADLSWRCFSTELSWACGPPKGMKNAFCPVTALHGSVAFPFVIPSAAEGSAVQRTFRGNVFRPSVAEWSDLQLRHPNCKRSGVQPSSTFPPSHIAPKEFAWGGDRQNIPGSPSSDDSPSGDRTER